jgi:hypothetical protein
MATKQEVEQAKLDALAKVVNSYVRLVYRFPDGDEYEVFGHVYSNLTLSGNWIDLEILVRIERRDKGIETVYNTEPIKPWLA